MPDNAIAAIRNDIPAKPTVKNKYGTLIEALEPGQSIEIEKIEREKVLNYMRRWFPHWSTGTRSYNGRVYLQRIK